MPLHYDPKKNLVQLRMEQTHSVGGRGYFDWTNSKWMAKKGKTRNLFVPR
jgi:hypothetical protein